MNKIIAIDGPAGSGKSSTALQVAKELNFKFLDTGSIYRAATYYCLGQEVPLDDQTSVHMAVLQMADEKSLEISVDPNNQILKLYGDDISSNIRERKISENVSKVSSCLDARKILVKMQKDIIEDYSDEGIVVEGRDATDVLANNAVVRIILNARDEVRAKRRAKDLNLDEKEVLDMIRERDNKDSQINNFTDATDGIILLDNSDISFDESVKKIIELYQISQK